MSPPTEGKEPLLGFAVTGTLDQLILSKVPDGMKKAADEWGVNLPKDLAFSFDKHLRRLGNRSLKERSVATYADHYKQLYSYCCLKGDYSSLLMLSLPCTTAGVPSILVGTAEEFLRLKRSPRNSELLDVDGAPVTDVLGGQIYADGCWNAPGKANQLSSAISDLHSAHRQNGAYQDACNDCRALPDEKKHRGCDRHVGCPRLHRSGNPTQDCIYKNSLRQSIKDGANWIEKGDSQLLPCDLRSIRTHLLSSNSLVGLQTWLICIIAVKLFLRPDEVLSLEVSSIQKDLIVWKDGHCHSVTFEVMGKCDRQNVHLVAWADDENPDLCPIRPLLVYLHLSGIKSGALFPVAAELHGEILQEKVGEKTAESKKKTTIYRRSDGHFEHPVQYKPFLRAFKIMAGSVIPDKQLKIGLHCFRKTAYLIGIWGKGEWAELKHSARHVTDRHSQTYRDDAAVMMMDSEILGCPNNSVSPFKPIRRKPMSAGARQNMNSIGRTIGISGVASKWVEESLNFPPSHAFSRCQATLVNAAHEFQRSGLQSATEFAVNVLGLNGDMLVKFLHWNQNNLSRDREEQQKDHQQNEGATQTPITEQNASDIPTPPEKKKRKIGTVDLEGYKDVKNIQDLKSKVQKILQLHQLAPKNKSSLTAGAQTFLSRTAVPIAACLQKHHGGNIDAFVSHWQGMFKSKFSSECCKGEGTACGKFAAA